MPSTGRHIPFVKSGDRPRAEDQNAIIRQLSAYGNLGDHGSSFAGGMGKFFGVKNRPMRDQDVILVRNATGGHLTDEHPVLGLGDPVIDPDDSSLIVHRWPVAFQGEEPNDDDHVNKFVVLDGPVQNGKYQTGVISGVAWVKIKNDSDDDDFADIDDGETGHLISAGGGSAKILWREDVSVGQVGWGLVRISNPSAADLEVLGPCTTYTPNIALPDTDFGIDYLGSGCLGPSRWGLQFIGTSGTLTPGTFRVLELSTESPLFFSTASWSHSGCGAGSITMVAELSITSLGPYGVELTFLDGMTQKALYTNALHRFNPDAGGYLQLQEVDCECINFAYDACLSKPTR